MCRRRHKTAYGRRQLQIGQQSLLYLYKMHESTEDPRSTPPTPHPSAYLGFSFWEKMLNSSNGSDEGLWRSISCSVRATDHEDRQEGMRVEVGQNRGYEI